MPRVVHFEINADNPERAVRFYSQAFNWKIEKWGGPEDYWLCTTGESDEPGINGAIMRRPEPGVKTVNSISVDSVDEYIARIEQAGGKALTPKMTIPGAGLFAYCEDTEGNRFGIIQNLPPDV